MADTTKVKITIIQGKESKEEVVEAEVKPIEK